MKTVKIEIEGYVQGVGFRPFIARLAEQHRQSGWIANTNQGVSIAIEGLPEDQMEFLDNIDKLKPAFTEITSLTVNPEPFVGYAGFQVRDSITGGAPSAFVLTDIAICSDCIQDIFNPDSRFYGYPLTSCSHCGPRYSIMTSQPYDRASTSMAAFGLCQDCRQDYLSINNRRFHAQTIACPNCGPQLQFLDESGAVLAEKQDAISRAVEKIKAGKIVAIKSIGGYQLIVDATNRSAIERLRTRKSRPKKPFALMARDLEATQKLCFINQLEQTALLSPAAPIVLLKKRDNPKQIICAAVAPDINLLGIMLPYSALHHLLLANLDFPLITTSGNRQDEPICITETEVLTRLDGIADYFLTHNRPVLRPLDDSIVREINGKMTVLRRARGYVPLPINTACDLPGAIALGGQLKNTVAIALKKHSILSQHLGNLETETAQQLFQSTLADLQDFYQIMPDTIMHDAHKGYFSSQFAENIAGTKVPVQHHYAHALSCMAEHQLEPPALAVVWDGSGMGDDNTLWGGEFLLITEKGFRRFAHFRPFPLPGGIKAIREPRRTALGLHYDIHADNIFDQPDLPFTHEELLLLKAALDKQINCPRTTSVGRLFDGVASMLGLCQISSYEGQAAMLLESLASETTTEQSYPFELVKGETIAVNWQITIKNLIKDLKHNTPSTIAAKFHNTLAEIMAAVAMLAQQQTIVLSGGCFQNAVLAETAAGKLKSAGFKVYCHERVPPNDGGLALGQLVAAKYIGH